jgi:tRNA nucleotidyltransferase (CCA-adding enzyme)
MEKNTFVSLIENISPEPLIDWLRTQKKVKPLSALYGVDERLEYHPEGDSGIHLEMAVAQAWRWCATSEQKVAVVLHDIGKSVTGLAIENPTTIFVPPRNVDINNNVIPSHIGHDVIGACMMPDVFKQLDIPLEWLPLSISVAKLHQRLHAFDKLSTNAIIRFVEEISESMPLKSRGGAVDSFVRCVRSDFNGRLGFKEMNYDQGDHLIHFEKIMCLYDADEIEREKIKLTISILTDKILQDLKTVNADVSANDLWVFVGKILREKELLGEIPLKPRALKDYFINSSVDAIEKSQVKNNRP